ncbi:MAG: hypothetical protein JWN98_2226 [Abditibacteriota bacterium]|nr:hypothetical protein [Abditibacteriota bacterium]
MKRQKVIFYTSSLVAILLIGGLWVNKVIHAPDLRMGRYRRVSNVVVAGNIVSQPRGFVLDIKPGGTWVQSVYGSGRHIDRGPYTLDGNNIRVIVLTDHTYEYNGRFEDNTLILEYGSFKIKDTPNTEQRYLKIPST